MYKNSTENNDEEFTSTGKRCRCNMYLENASTRQEDDEISRSLKMFAMLTAYKPEPPSQSQNQVDAIMREFACNGYSCDDMRYQRQTIYEPLSNHMDLNLHCGLWKTLPHYGQTDYMKKQKKYQNGLKSDKYSMVKHCVFCENNNEPEAVVKSHAVRDSLGRVLCPKLRTYVCPICKASGDMAHTIKYCPQKPIITMEDAIRAEQYNRLSKSAYLKHQMKI